jgi:uncharacterized protein (DUF952 family)
VTLIYKLLDAAAWRAAEAEGSFTGSPVDLADGFIHFSTAAQARETARRYFRGASDLLLLEVDTGGLGAALKWEPSRGGDLFPHLYGPMPASAVRRIEALALDTEGVPVIGTLEP